MILQPRKPRKESTSCKQAISTTELTFYIRPAAMMQSAIQYTYMYSVLSLRCDWTWVWPAELLASLQSHIKATFACTEGRFGSACWEKLMLSLLIAGNFPGAKFSWIGILQRQHCEGSILWKCVRVPMCACTIMLILWVAS